ncbi:MAG: hypothetical protein M3331_02150 [Actinomycetota bacterium]|nr:hypothetical protein [Actinomycetota bacterium]
MRTPARVTVLPDPETGPISTAGAVKSVQEATVEMPVELYERLWKPEYLERLARSYWAFLTKISLGAIRIVYEPSSRTVVFISRRLPLLRFRRPEYTIGPGLGQVTWRIERGLLVSPNGRGQGMLRITVRSSARSEDSGDACVRVRTEVSNFYPFLRGGGWFARIGVQIYSATQVRIHTWVTHGFLRSLARLDLPRSPVGALAPHEGDSVEELESMDADQGTTGA